MLIVEDDASTREGLAELVQTWGFQTEEAADGEEGLRKVTSFRPAIIVSDMVMPRVGGMELLRALKDQLSDLTLILLTAQGTVETAVEAIKEGAYDYLSKPVDPQRLRILLNKAVERQETLREVKLLRRQLREQGSFGRNVGNSPGMRSLYRVSEQAAPTAASVLVWGESGLHVAIVAKDRASVDAFHREALAASGKDNGAPGLRPQYHPNYYGAFGLDPDGHNIEAVCHMPG